MKDCMINNKIFYLNIYVVVYMFMFVRVNAVKSLKLMLSTCMLITSSGSSNLSNLVILPL